MKFGTVVLVGTDVRKKRHNWKVSTDYVNASVSTRILGRFAAIASLTHPNLCKYLELFKCQTVPHGILIVSEHYSIKYSTLQTDFGKYNFDAHTYFCVAEQVCSALDFCHNNLITVGSLCLDNILVCAKPSKETQIRVKLANFGLFHLTGNNEDIEELISSPWYLAPECLLELEGKEQVMCSYYTDIWAFGIVLIELFSGWKLSKIWRRKQVLSVLNTIVLKTSQGSCLNNLLSAMENSCSALKSNKELLDPVYSIAEQCLGILPSKRPDATILLQMIEDREIIHNQSTGKGTIPTDPIDESINAIKERIRNDHQNDLTKYGFDVNSLNELFFLWKLCGSTVESILIRTGAIRGRPPVLTLPRLLINENQLYGNERTRKNNSVLEITELPINNLIERLNSIPRDELFISIELSKLLKEKIDNEKKSIPSPYLKLENFSQSLVVKERDIDYQFKRMRLFRHLLASWPYKSDLFRYECQRDIPPIHRGAVWAALLGVLPFSGEQCREHFYAIDTFTEHPSDRQLQVDIPRCHQYDELMSSPMAHYRMKLLIKALLISRKDDFVYWQGLDSLSAPFLILHFNDLPTAFRCLNAFIDRYLCGFFLRDNSTVVRNYLAEFMRALEFADPELFTQLISLDFHPELFAIPWFLTCFAHVLPLHKLFHLWDSLLLAGPQFPLFIGVSILIQLRSRLISVNFNEAILLFSDLPDLSIDEVVQTAKIHYVNWQGQGLGSG